MFDDFDTKEAFEKSWEEFVSRFPETIFSTSEKLTAQIFFIRGITTMSNEISDKLKNKL